VGPRRWIIDTATNSIWFSLSEFRAAGGTDFFATASGAESADGSPLAAIGEGRVSFSLWGHLFRRMPVRIMATLPSRVLLGNSFIRSGLGMAMDLKSGRRQFSLSVGQIGVKVGRVANLGTLLVLGFFLASLSLC
jgi:hypothetical protein